jgi:hypothetical protein
MPGPRSVSDLCDRLAAGASVKYLFFWGHRPSQDGSITKTCLSQWFECPFQIDGIRYRTAEHFMMAEKARLFGDSKYLDRILTAPTPGAAKALGRSIRGFDEDRWNEHRSEIVVTGNLAKFSQNSPVKGGTCQQV